LFKKITLGWLCAVSSFGTAFAVAPYEGQTLKVLAFKDGHSQAVAANLKMFEAMTGAKVVLDLIASNAVATKISTDQASGGTYDLYTVDEPFMPQFSTFFLPLQEWEKPRIIDKKETDLGSFLPAAVAGGAYKGVNFGLPVNGNVYMYVYRADLFNDPKEKTAFKAKYNYELATPKSTDQMRDVAEFFTRPPRMYGFAPFTKMSEGTTVEAIWVLNTFGVSILDDKLQVVMNEQQATKAFEFYNSMMKFAPPGSTSWHHSERMAAYSKGMLAQIMTWPSYVKDLENPDKSMVVGKNAYAEPPAAQGGKPSAVAGTWTVAIPKTAKSKALAAEFAYWWASSSFGKTIVAQGMNPARKDLLTNPELVKTNPWFPGVLANFQGAVVRPRFPEYKQISDVISLHFTKMISSQATPAEAAKGIKSDVESMLKKAKY
jgi:multiple sugar transport system substrate-binding protein